MSICNPPFRLKELNIIGGDYQEILFPINNDDKTINADDLMLNFSLVEYKNRYGAPLINRNCELSTTDNSAFIMILYPEDTKDFSGKYIYQITVKAPNNKQQNFQGILTIDKNINPSAFVDNTVIE